MGSLCWSHTAFCSIRHAFPGQPVLQPQSGALHSYQTTAVSCLSCFASHSQCAGAGPEVICSTKSGALITSGASYMWTFPVALRSCKWLLLAGGGFSEYAPAPSWQAAAVATYVASGAVLPPAGSFNKTKRGYPDLSAIGRNILIIENGTGAVVDGTSASAPIIAAFLAAVNAARIANGKPVLGFVNPAIYAAAASVPGVFTDINCPGCVNNAGDSTMNCSAAATGYGTAPGWDAVTGWGTPNVTALLAALVGNVSKSNAPTSSRTQTLSRVISPSISGTHSVSSSNAPSASQSASLSSSASSSDSPLQSLLVPEPSQFSRSQSPTSTPTTVTASASVAVLTDHSSSQESSDDARATSSGANATIAGAVVGGVVGATAIAALVYLAARRREQRPRVIPTLSVVCIASGPDPRAGNPLPSPSSVVAPVGFPLSPAPRELSVPDRIVVPSSSPSSAPPLSSDGPSLAIDDGVPSFELRHPSETAPCVVREEAVSIAASEQASRALSRMGVADQPAGPPETPTSTLQPPDTPQCELLTSPQGSPPVGSAPPSLTFLEIEPHSPLATAISASERADALTTLDAPAQPCPPERTRMGMPERISTASVALRAHVHAPPRHRRHSLSALDAAQMQQISEPPVAVLPSHAASPSGAPGPLGDASRGDPEAPAVQTPRVRRHTSVGPHPAHLVAEADAGAAWLRRPPRAGSSGSPLQTSAGRDPLRAPMSAAFAIRGGAGQ